MPTFDQLKESLRVHRGIFGYSAIFPEIPEMNDIQSIIESKIDWINPKINIKESLVSGKGMFAKDKIFKDEVVIVFGNNYVDKEQIQIFIENKYYVIQWDENLFSYEIPQNDLGYFINHCCDPNCWMKSNNPFTVIARRDIIPGEEVRADYAIWETDTTLSDFKCNCGSKDCRRIITLNDWKLPELQKKYENHFSPYLNKKIKGMI